MNREKMKQQHSERVQLILDDYKKAVQVIESAKWTDQQQTVCNFCNAVIRKHGYMNGLHKMSSFWYRLKIFLTGEHKYRKRIFTMLDDVSAEMNRLVDEMSEDLRDRPSSIGYGSNEHKKSIESIKKDIKENEERKAKEGKIW